MMAYSDLTEAQRLWVDALRSGKYAQCRKFLHRINDGKDSYCCFGVACEVYKEHGGELNITSKKIVDFDSNMVVFYNGHNAMLPRVVQDWLGLNYGYANLELATLNDNYSFNFNKIADVIESKPQGLFTE